MRELTWAGVLAILFVLPALGRAGEQIIEDRLKPPDVDKYDPNYKDYLQKKQAMRDQVQAAADAERQKAKDQIQKEVTDVRKNKLEPLATASVTEDEESKEVKEPNSSETALNRPSIRDQYEISPDDFDLYVHDRWSLNKSDLRFDAPQYLVAEETPGHTRAWFGFTYSITNSTVQARRIAPAFVAVTNKGVFSQQVGGFLPERILADSTFHPLADSNQPRDKFVLDQHVSPLESVIHQSTSNLKEGAFQFPGPSDPMARFESGQTRWGAALWPDFNNEFTELSIVVHGLTNAHRFTEKQRKVLVLSFTRNDDEFHVQRSPLVYQGKEWKYLWMWDQDIAVPIPADPKDAQIKEKSLDTPAGGQRLLWSFPFTITNSTPTNQSLRIREVAFVLRGADNLGLPVEVDGQKIGVEVRVLDDGRSSIYKAQYLRDLSLANPAKDTDRFAPDVEKRKDPGGMIHLLESGKSLEGLRAVFDINDVDWTNVLAQVEAQLTLALDKKALSAKKPGGLYDPRRKLTEEEWAKVREQITAAVPAAVQAAKQKKQVMAYFTCEAGLSSGAYRISRSYRKPGEIDESWLKAWEELDK